MALPTLFTLAARPTGPNLPPLSYEQFTQQVAPYRREMLSAVLTSAAWVGWQSDFPSKITNDICKALAPRIAVLAAALGANTGTASPGPRELELLIGSYIRLRDAVSIPESAAQVAADLARSAIRSPLAPLIPTLDAARSAVGMFSLARTLRAQWEAQLSTMVDMLRTLWIARRIDEDAATTRAVERMLGMPVHVFARACQALIALAYVSEPQGRIAITGSLDATLTDSYELSQDVLRLAASKLCRTPDELLDWHAEEVSTAPDGLKQYVPSALNDTPLIRVDKFVDSGAPPYSHFLCPSVQHFTTAVNTKLRSVVAGARAEMDDKRGKPRNVRSLYGQAVEDYVAMVLRASLGAENVVKLEDWESGQQEKADYFVACGDHALIIELKRSVGSDVGKYILDCAGIRSVMLRLYDAYRQCETTFDRRPWRRVARFQQIKRVAAVVLIDEIVVAEGGALSFLFSTTRQPRPPFEVMGISEFENALPVLGLPAFVEMVLQKWDARHSDLPLRLFASKVLKTAQREVKGAMSYLTDLDHRILLSVGLAGDSYTARWP